MTTDAQSIPAIEGRVCRECNEFKPFLLLKKNYGGKKGHQRLCLECASNKAQKWKKANPEKHQAQKDAFHGSQLKRVYGIGPDDYTQMFAEQHGRCKICKRHQEEFNKRLFVDHCHTTGVVRGLLCYHCNTMLGMAKDNTDTLKEAIEYLESNR